MQAEAENDLAEMLADLANVYPSAEAIARLQKRWPDLLPPEPPKNVTITVRYTDTSTGTTTSPNIPEKLQWVIWLSELVKSLWIGNPTSKMLGDLEHTLLTGSSWSPPSFLPGLFPNPRPIEGIIGIDWKRRTFVYRPQTALQRALYYLLKESRRAKFCGNPDCQAPYFFGSRSNSKYCSSDCTAAMVKQAKRDWWAESGAQWRQDRKSNKEKQPNGSKRARR